MKNAVDAALGAGYRLFDTAKFYFNEAFLGEALEVCLPRHDLKREDVYITTKIYPTSSNDYSEEVEKVVVESLNNLRTTYLDLVLIHFPKTKESPVDDPNNATHRKNTYLALEKLKASGNVRSVGVSNYEEHHIEEIKGYGQDMPAVLQVEFHPHFTREKLKNYCANNGIFFQAYSSLARQNEELLEHEDVRKLAIKNDTSAQIILLSWAHRQGVGIIPKSAQPSRIAENMKTTEIKLEGDEIILLRNLNKNKNYVRCEGWLVL
ncbi:oxidoreductase, aldo/keto reductase family protein [Ancylostoma caninum]|uniref:Oxidoreductase, aldo/keto reductase family protein n=1 Tax=Ancylostoma caninum TaxID=29170 RepID=A0A368GU40_ANCCA|nr:oxidoreductase, aldo/keto reductase family protein [Ancylostoma caninum]